jgi:hypothetical protein
MHIRFFVVHLHGFEKPGVLSSIMMILQLLHVSRLQEVAAAAAAAAGF